MGLLSLVAERKNKIARRSLSVDRRRRDTFCAINIIATMTFARFSDLLHDTLSTRSRLEVNLDIVMNPHK